jgi:ParB family transcriptional regulator, chromosome partitioning protein
VSEKNMPRLGKGLEALIPKSFLASGRTITQIPISQIKANAYQPRLSFNDEALKTLSHSIKTHGLAQPIIVRRSGNDGYELVAGERRYRASILAQLDRVPAIIRDMSDKESLQLALIENIDREDLNAIEEAKGYQRLINEFSLTQTDVAETFGRSRSSVSNLLRLLALPEVVQQAVSDSLISEGHARAMLVIEDEAAQIELLSQIISKQLSVRDVEAIVSGLKTQGVAKSTRRKRLFSTVEEELGNRLFLPVKITGDLNKGTISLKFKSNEDLERILLILSSKSSVAEERDLLHQGAV